LTRIPHFKDQKLSTRRDVINKTILRIMKRFYIQLFKEMHPHFKPKSTSANSYLEACSNFIKSLKGFISVNDNLKYLIVSMMANNLTDEYMVDDKTKKSLKLLHSCLYSYSHKALKNMHEDSSLRLLFNYFYQNGQKFFKMQNNVQKNYSGYITALENIYKSFNGPALE